MRKNYLILMYEGPLDGWRAITYSDVASAPVYDDEGIHSLEDAEKVYELIASSFDDHPLVLVQVIKDNGIEKEYKG